MKILLPKLVMTQLRLMISILLLPSAAIRKFIVIGKSLGTLRILLLINLFTVSQGFRTYADACISVHTHTHTHTHIHTHTHTHTHTHSFQLPQHFQIFKTIRSRLFKIILLQPKKIKKHHTHTVMTQFEHTRPGP
jgi:hypothetical protein